jgi:hypothetical protein
MKIGRYDISKGTWKWFAVFDTSASALYKYGVKVLGINIFARINQPVPNGAK